MADNKNQWYKGYLVYPHIDNVIIGLERAE